MNTLNDNLTTLQINYLLVKLSDLNDIIKEKNYVAIEKEIKENNHKHNTNIVYDYTNENYNINVVAKIGEIRVYKSGILNDSFVYFTRNMLVNAIENDIYIIRYKRLEKSLQELYSSINDKWLNIEQYNMLKNISNKLGYFIEVESVKKYNDIVYVSIGKQLLKKEHYTMYEKLNNKLDIECMEKNISQLQNEEYINKYYIKSIDIESGKSFKVLLTDIINNDKKKITEYFNSNILPNLIDRDINKYSIDF